MPTDAITPQHLPENAQQFLFACAFWIMAADEELTADEQNWLALQFGEDAYLKRLNTMLELPDGQFLPTFDMRAQALSDDEKALIYPGLKKWLCQCVTADGQLRPAENEVMRSIGNRIHLDAELERLQSPPAVPGPPPVPTEQPVSEPDPLPQVDEKSILRSMEPTAMEEERLPEPFQPEAMPESRTDADEVSVLAGHEAEITAIAVHPDKTFAATGDKNGMISFWDVDEGEQKKQYKAHEKEIVGLCYLSDGSRLVSADRSGRVACWSPDSADAVWQTTQTSTGGISAISVSPVDSRIAVASPGCRIGLIDARSGEQTENWRMKGWSAFRCIAFSPDGKTIAAGSDDRILRLIDSATGEETSALSHDGAVLSLAYTPDGRTLVSGCRDNDLYVWDLKTHTLMRRLTGHTFSIYGVAIDKNSTRVLSASWDHTAKLWDLNTGELLLNYENPDGSFNAVEFLNNCQTALAACSDRKVYLFRL